MGKSLDGRAAPILPSVQPIASEGYGGCGLGRTRLINSAALLLLAFASLWAISIEVPRVVPEHGLWDFGSFVASGRAAAQGLNPYGIYPPLTLHVSLPGFEAWNPNLNPPISALLFQLFDLADPHVALRIWWWISIVAYASAVGLLLRRYVRGLEAVVLGLWAFALAGFWDTLYLGQIYLPLVLAAVGAWLLLERGAFVQSGILIGLVVAIKPNFLVWPVLLLLAGHRVPALVCVVTAGVISAIPLVVFGPEIYIQWLILIANDSDRMAFLTNGSLAGLAARGGVPEVGLILSVALLLCLAVWAWRQHPSAMRASTFGLLGAVLASPLGWIHYTLFLLPVLLHHWDRKPIWIVAALLVVPVPFFIDRLTAPVLTQLTTGSAYGWALVLCLAVLIASEWRERRGADEVRTV